MASTSGPRVPAERLPRPSLLRHVVSRGPPQLLQALVEHLAGASLSLKLEVLPQHPRLLELLRRPGRPAASVSGAQLAVENSRSAVLEQRLPHPQQLPRL